MAQGQYRRRESLASSGQRSVQEVGQLGYQWPKVSTGRWTVWLAVVRGQYRKWDSLTSFGKMSVQEVGQLGFSGPRSVQEEGQLG